MRHEIVGLNKDGDVVDEYESFREVAEEHDYNIRVLYHRSYNCIPSPNGILYLRRENYEKILAEGDISKYFNNNLSRRYRKNFIHEKKERPVNHTVQYQTQGKLICITPCPFLSWDESKVRPKVGSGGCTRCRFFVSKDSVNKTVGCSYSKAGMKKIQLINETKTM